MTALVQHVAGAVSTSNVTRLEPVFCRERPVGSTGQMGVWYTGRPTVITGRSHINRAVLDSTWEASDAWALDHHPNVAAWAKNDHLGFQVYYSFRGGVHAFRPDFLVRLVNGDMLVLETKGQDDDEQRTKREALDRWVQAVNEHGAFGHWSSAVALKPGEILDLLAQA
jgi:type III restriction enzyme